MHAVALSLCLLLPGTEPAPDNLEGVYLVRGEMTGSAVIRRTEGSTYLVQWCLSKGTPEGIVHSATVDVGLRVGDSFSVAWPRRDGVGVTVYRINGRVLAGQSSAGGTEELHRLSRLPEE